MSESLILPEAYEIIGKESTGSSGIVYKKEFQRWASSVNDLNPLYFDEEFAKSQGYRDVIMPPLFLGQVMSGVMRLERLKVDGTPGGGGGGRQDIPLKVSRRMAGGTETEFLAPIYPGDILSTVSKTVAIEQKEGRSGPFVLITGETNYTNQDGVVVARSRNSSIVR